MEKRDGMEGAERRINGSPDCQSAQSFSHQSIRCLLLRRLPSFPCFFLVFSQIQCECGPNADTASPHSWTQSLIRQQLSNSKVASCLTGWQIPSGLVLPWQTHRTPPFPWHRLKNKNPKIFSPDLLIGLSHLKANCSSGSNTVSMERLQW